MLVRAFLLTAAGVLFFPVAAGAADPANAEALARQNLERLAEANGPVIAVALSPDGKQLASGGFGRVVRLWDTATGQEIRQLEHPRGVNFLAFSADGKMLASAGDRRIRLWDTASGKEIRCLKVEPGESFCLAFSPDGQTLATAGEAIRLWNTATGRELGRLDNHFGAVFGLAFSPDGKMLASGGEDGVLRLWNMPRRRELRRWTYPRGLTCLTFSPDGQLLAAGDGDGTIRLWDPANGKQRLEIANRIELSCQSLAFSANGKVLVSERGLGIFRGWDVATGKELSTRMGFRTSLLPVTFCQGSGALATDDHPLAKLWDVTDPDKKLQSPPFHFTADEFALLWEDLASDRDILAATAVETLSLDSRQVVPFLKERLRPEGPYPPLAKLIAELDSNRFPVRQRATEQLERLGQAAEPALRQALRNRPPLEVRRRIETILARVGQNLLPPDLLRARNAVRVLRRLGTSEARQLLQTLATGAPEGLITRSAKEALQKLDDK